MFLVVCSIVVLLLCFSWLRMLCRCVSMCLCCCVVLVIFLKYGYRFSVEVCIRFRCRLVCVLLLWWFIRVGLGDSLVLLMRVFIVRLVRYLLRLVYGVVVRFVMVFIISF